MSTSSIWQRPTFSQAVLLFAFVLGCSDPAPSETSSNAIEQATSTDTSSTSSSSSTTQAVVASEPQSASTDATNNAASSANNAVPEVAIHEEAKSKEPPNPPLHLDEVLQRIDLRTLPFMEGNTRASAGIEFYGFSAPVSEKFSIDSVMSYLDKLLLDANCMRSADPSLEFKNESGARWVYWHGDLMVIASCGISRGSTSPDINSGIQIAGNVDIRNLPPPPNATIIESLPHAQRLSCPVEIFELRKFYTDKLRELGWIEFRDYLPDVDVPVEKQLPHQNFLKNGICISIYHHKTTQAEASQSEYETSVSTGVFESEPMLPSNARSVKIRQSSPIALAFETELSPHDLRAFYDDAYLSRGYRGSDDKTAKEDQDFNVTYKHPQKPSMRIEAQLFGDSSIVVANESK